MAKKVAWDYVVPVKLPADLKGVKPGKLPDALLKTAVGGGKLHHLAADAWAAMVAKAKADGVELKPTSSGDTYRSYDAQLKAFLERYTKEANGNSTRTFEGVKWYKKNEKLASLAAPGTSQHNLGIAVDVHTASGARLEWLIDNVKDFGFSWEVVPEEPWHLRYVAGDDVPAAVAAFAGKEVSTASTPAPAPAAAAAAKEETPAPVAVSASKPAPANDDADSLDIGSRGPKVRQLQQALKAKSIYQGPVDGEYGPLLAAAVKKFKVANKLAADGKAGSKVFKLLGI